MTHDEFKNWFQGLVDATDGELSKKHCDKVFEKPKEITPVSVPYYSPSLTSTSF